VVKDTRRLPAAYFQAGVREFWLADARGRELVFRIHTPGPSAYQAAEPDTDGYQFSPVFGRHFRLDGSRDEQGIWSFDLRQKE